MAMFQKRKHFIFESDAYAGDKDKFRVVAFHGGEEISWPFRFDITLASTDAEVDMRKVIQNPARLIVNAEGEKMLSYYRHGILEEFDQLQQVGETVTYRAVLVPKLSLATLARHSRVYLDQTIDKILETVLKDSGLEASDYDLRLAKEYPTLEYVCQYQETNLEFLGRWMEHYGIYYFHEHTDAGARLIITDTCMVQPAFEIKDPVRYTPPSGQLPAEPEVVHSLTCRHRMMSEKVTVRDYNYRTPRVMPEGEEPVDDQGRGEMFLYGEHVKDAGEAKDIAQVRAQALACRENEFIGEGSHPVFEPGYVFTLKSHYRKSYDQQYLLTGVQHIGSEKSHYQLGGGDSESALHDLSYRNTFQAIPTRKADQDVQYRPKRRTRRPRFYGTMNARVDAGGNGQYAELDDQGRYKVILPFDQVAEEGGKASRWIRMAQPYSGPGYGFHFPLHKGAEVLLTFIDGDLDRPIISGTVPNPANQGPVKDANQTKSIIKTAGGNQIAIEDSQGSEQIHMSTPYANTKFWLGAPNKGKGVGLKTDECLTIDVAKDKFETINGNVKTVIDKTHDLEIKQNELKKVIGNVKKEIKGMKEESVAKDFKRQIFGNKDDWVKGDFKAQWDGLNIAVTAGLHSSTYIGLKWEKMLSATLKLGYGYEKNINFAEKDSWTGSAKFIGSKARLDLRGGNNDKDNKKNGDANIELDSTSLRLFTKEHGNEITMEKAGDINIKAKQNLNIEAPDGDIALASSSGKPITFKAEAVKVNGKIKHKYLETS